MLWYAVDPTGWLICLVNQLTYVPLLFLHLPQEHSTHRVLLLLHAFSLLPLTSYSPAIKQSQFLICEIDMAAIMPLFQETLARIKRSSLQYA